MDTEDEIELDRLRNIASELHKMVCDSRNNYENLLDPEAAESAAIDYRHYVIQRQKALDDVDAQLRKMGRIK